MNSCSETTVICPNCGEDNSPAFRFCGMCGAPLESQRGTPGPTTTASPEPTHASAKQTSEQPRTATDKVSPQPKPAATIVGPSLLGLNSTPEEARSLDILGDKSFSGLDSFYEAEESHTHGRRILLLLLLLAILGAAGWWTYSNYRGAMNRAIQTASSTSTPANPQNSPETPAVQTATQSTPPSPSAPTSSAPPSSSAPRSTTTQSPSAPLAPGGNPPLPEASPQPSSPEQETTAVEPKPSTPPPAKQSPRKEVAEAVPSKPAKQPRESRSKTADIKISPVPGVSGGALAEGDKGDADYRKGEAFLYGRGAAENCDQAVKYLKAASAKQNAKARSTFGTMYATGHCVPRDLPTSYGWFALALRVDPNNQILEKDLTAVWNQMTPPEREMAKRTKP